MATSTYESIHTSNKHYNIGIQILTEKSASYNIKEWMDEWSDKDYFQNDIFLLFWYIPIIAVD